MQLMDIQTKKKPSLLNLATSARRQSSSVLFSRGRRSEHFFTEDSDLYLTPRQKHQLEAGFVLQAKARRWDSLCERLEKQGEVYRDSRTNALYHKLLGRLEMLRQEAQQASRSFGSQFSMAQLWNMSIVGAILLGMVSMSLIYKMLGPGASAQDLTEPATATVTTQVVPPVSVAADPGQLAAATAIAPAESAFDKRTKELVEGYPIEEMLPYILNKDKKVAAMMLGIAKQESSWGQRVPVLDGQDCDNYWGYREQRQLLGSGGHTCFNSQKDAVDTVAKRIKTLMDLGYSTPGKMIIWKCGDSCVGDSSEQRWISTVSSIYDELMAH